jgi:hypothetical protein
LDFEEVVADYVHLDPWRAEVCFFWVMCLVCIQFSDCVGRHTQLIWTLGVQKFVLFVLGDLLGMFPDYIQKNFVSQSGWRRRLKGRQKQV